MAASSDALVVFGVTGDLAHKMIFPALYAMVKRGALKVPVIGVALPNWSLERLHRRVADSIKRSGGIDNERVFKHFLSLLRYVSGDYKDPATFSAIKKALGDARRPAYYLAIPPSLFAIASLLSINQHPAYPTPSIPAFVRSQPCRPHTAAVASALARWRQSKLLTQRNRRILAGSQETNTAPLHPVWPWPLARFQRPIRDLPS